MRPSRLSFVLIFILSLTLINSAAQAQVKNPHGALNISCESCHGAESWGKLLPNPAFNHNQTAYPLEGRHASVNCRSCHKKLVFRGAKTDCRECHQDVHRNQLGGDCRQCHNPTSWIDYPLFRQQHSSTRFPLIGAHAQLSCQECHQKGQYINLPLNCEGCHLDMYTAAQNPSHINVGFNTDCEACHSQLKFQWQGVSFTHTAAFPLTGGHNVSDCGDCHTAPIQTISSMCFSCHQADYDAVTDPDHASNVFPTDCNMCHTTMTWTPSTFNHNQTAFPLTGAHTAASCDLCHSTGVYAGTPADCYSCHQEDFTSVESPNHISGQFSQNCLDCHTTQVWTPSTFDHNATEFPLTGAHIPVTCNLCHINEIYTGTPTDCFSCHQSDYNSVTDPNHQAAQLNHDCLQCHTTGGWTPSTFNHNLTAYPLSGAHTSVSCQFCHINGVFAGTPSDCWSCHQSDYNAAEDPNHQAAQFSQDCLQCHTTTGWTPSTFDHSQTGFTLTGAHTTTACGLCHINGVFAGTPSDCWSCHQSDYNAAVDPNHQAAQFSQDCLQCHTTTGWTPSTFDHSSTAFPLTGAHTSASCEDCHINGVFAGTPSDCWSCHQSDYNAAEDPNHQAAQFSQDCLQCHTTTGWTPSTFNHSLTSFPLTGAHTSASCEDCHINGVFAGTPSDCWSCHQSDYNSVSDPNHIAGQFSQNCLICHTTSAWTPSTLDHNQTGFPLTGAHTTTACELCHIDGVYAGTPTDCWSCHEDDYNSVSDPNHLAGQFSQDCQQCHTTTGWTPSTFSHSQTGFPLTGAHTTTSCELCHINGVFAGTPTDCWSCHEDDYNSVSDPNHLANQFPQDCMMCHTTAGWTPVTFDHNQTAFPLTGAHNNTACDLCHIDGVYAGTPTDCWSCHEDDYTSVSDPNHVTNQFPQDCLVCHTTAGWTPVTFDHNTSGFPLTGAHTTTACDLCHINGVYAGTPTDCWSCHEDDYTSAADPNHVTNQFPQDCLVCHTTAGWTPVTFDHNTSGFPLTGAHITTACVLCHINGVYAGTPTDCWSCHEDDYTSAADPNHVAGQYNQVCTECHTTTGWTPATFDHSGTSFPLTGAHITADCYDCHVGGQFTGTPTTCFFCHQGDYNTATNPNHLAAGYPTSCQFCHTTFNWNSNFNHDQQYFPIYSGEHRNEWDQCSDCHPNPANYQVFTCTTACHPQGEMNEEHQGIPGYVYQSNACLACHPDGGTDDYFFKSTKKPKKKAQTPSGQ